MIKRLLSKKTTRYILIGGVSYVIEVGILATCVYLGAQTWLAVTIAFWVGFVVSLFLQKIIVFQDRDKRPRTLFVQTLLYGTLVAFNYVFTLVFISSLEAQLGVIVARTIALILTTGWNFIIYNKMIFRENSQRI